MNTPEREIIEPTKKVKQEMDQERLAQVTNAANEINETPHVILSAEEATTGRPVKRITWILAELRSRFEIVQKQRRGPAGLLTNAENAYVGLIRKEHELHYGLDGTNHPLTLVRYIRGMLTDVKIITRIEAAKAKALTEKLFEYEKILIDTIKLNPDPILNDVYQEAVNIIGQIDGILAKKIINPVEPASSDGPASPPIKHQKKKT